MLLRPLSPTLDQTQPSERLPIGKPETEMKALSGRDQVAALLVKPNGRDGIKQGAAPSSGQTASYYDESIAHKVRRFLCI